MAKAKSQSAPGLYNRAAYELLRQTRRNLSELIATLDKARACGVDCQMYEQMRADLDKQLEAIELHFMTPAPTA